MVNVIRLVVNNIANSIEILNIMQRRIDIYKDERDQIIKNNTRNLIVGVCIFILLTIILAKSGAGLFVTLLLGFFVIGMVFMINNSNMNEFEEKRMKKCIDCLVDIHGEYSLKIGKNSIETMIIVFPKVEILFINGLQFQFKEIIDFNINDMSSYRTTTSASSMIGRGMVGGLMFGGVGALAGANSASSTTVKENNRYKFNIILKDFSNPNFSCMIYNEEDASKFYSVLKLIVDKNIQN